MSFQDVAGTGAGPAGLRGGAQQDRDPSQQVAAGIFQINTSVNTFKRLVNTLGTPKDTPELRERLHKTRQQIGQLAKDTSAKLKAASEGDHSAVVSASKKLSDAKLAKDFQAVLKEFQKAQRTAAERETAFTPLASRPAASKPGADRPTANGTATLSSAEENQARHGLIAEQRRQELVQLDTELTFNEAVIEERDQGIREIQHQIVEVNEIFKDLAVLVHEQGQMIEDIETNIENTAGSTTQAVKQVAKASKSQRSSDNRACCLMILLVVVVVILVLILKP
ncbi:hypothetical protein CBR_g990 [Chara braunii]|uniref:t-SNARE coiled-coil homology domain-containing protein n=1 Tax=Chara braunii TaxID=69332 RepID=A0A388KCW5_CHABU|nr:hypothetical protein CBR_g990 [Chara braunii]|eukprot:GBG67871.1 hypothetical protein CBR_g990 [Chara braunii]